MRVADIKCVTSSYIVCYWVCASRYPILDVMVAADQGCGCSDLFLRREVGIWKNTCRDEIKTGLLYCYKCNQPQKA